MNKTGFEAFFKEKYSQAYFLALRILHDDEASKDVVADAFELVWRRTQQEKIENISAYLNKRYIIPTIGTCARIRYRQLWEVSTS